MRWMWTVFLWPFSATFGYKPCHDLNRSSRTADQADRIPGSVFTPGAGYPVKWYKVPRLPVDRLRHEVVTTKSRPNPLVSRTVEYRDFRHINGMEAMPGYIFSQCRARARTHPSPSHRLSGKMSSAAPCPRNTAASTKPIGIAHNGPRCQPSGGTAAAYLRIETQQMRPRPPCENPWHRPSGGAP